MAVTQYIGSRYVPLLAIPVEWSDQNTYEPLTIVTHEGNSYTSRQAVPKDIDILNEDYWALTGNYNAQVEQYRRETQTIAQEIQVLENDLEDTTEQLTTLVNDKTQELTQYVAGKTTELENYVNDKTAFADAATKKFTIETNYNDAYSTYVTVVTMPKNNFNIIPTLSTRHVNYEYSYQYPMSQHDCVIFNGSLGGPTLSNGNIVEDYDSADAGTWAYIIAFREDGTIDLLSDINGGHYTAAQLVSRGYIAAWTIFTPLIVNGFSFNFNQLSDFDNFNTMMSSHGQRINFGWDNDNYYVVITDGRTPLNIGLKIQEMQQLCADLHIPNIVSMDGGGSVQFWLTNPAQNIVYPNNAEREYPNKLNPQATRDLRHLIKFEFSN